MRKWINRTNIINLTLAAIGIYGFVVAIQEGKVITWLFRMLLYFAAYVTAVYAFSWIRSIRAVRSWARKYPHMVYIGLMQLELDNSGEYGSKLRRRVLCYAMKNVKG